MYYRWRSSVVTLRQILKELCLFLNLEHRKHAVLHNFPLFSPTCFDTLSWTFAYIFVSMYIFVLQIKFECRQFSRNGDIHCMDGHVKERSHAFSFVMNNLNIWILWKEERYHEINRSCEITYFKNTSLILLILVNRLNSNWKWFHQTRHNLMNKRDFTEEIEVLTVFKKNLPEPPKIS